MQSIILQQILNDIIMLKDEKWGTLIYFESDFPFGGGGEGLFKDIYTSIRVECLLSKQKNYYIAILHNDSKDISPFLPLV